MEELGSKLIQKLIQAGFESAQDVLAADEERLTNIEGIGEKTAEKIIAACKAAIEKAAAEKVVEEVAEETEAPSKLEFSPDDEGQPRPEDY